MSIKKILSTYTIAGLAFTLVSCKSELFIDINEAPLKGGGSAGVESVSVSALYPNFGQNWLDHLRNDSSNSYEASDDQDCNLSDLKIHDCIHGGEIRKFQVNSTNECAGLSASDELGVFHWHCIEKTDHVIFVSRLKSGKGLSDLITATNWRQNAVSVSDGSGPIAESEASIWWSDTISPAPSSMTSMTELNSPGIYTIDSNLNSGGYRIVANNVALVGIGPSAPTLSYTADGNYCSTDGSSGTSASCLITIPAGRENVWIENFKLADITTVDLPFFSRGLNKGHFRKISLSSTTQDSLDIEGGTGSKFIWVDTFHADGSDGAGIRFDSSVMAARVSNVKIANKNIGISLSGADNIILGPGSISQSASEGVISPSSSQGITMFGLNINNNIGAINVQGPSSNHDMTIVQSLFTNNDRGTSGAIRFENAGSIVFSHNLVANNTDDGIYTNIGSYSLVMTNTLLMNNRGSGYEGTGGTIQRFHNVGAFNNAGFGIGSYWSTDVLLTGQLIFGGNAGNDCGNFSGTTGVSSGSCTQSGNDNSNTYASGAHTAVYRKDRDVKLSFVGLPGDDALNSTPGVSSDSRVSSSDITDWLNFENSFRSFSLMGAGSDFLTSEERGDCDPLTLDSCDILDYSLLNSTNTANPVLLNQSGNDTLTDDQFNDPFTEGENCPAAIQGDETLSNEFTSIGYFLANAIEILDDGWGNDDGLCSSNERCIYAPNIGSYQGHGDYLSSGTCDFVDGVGPQAVTGVQMYAYPTNGY